MKKIIGLLVVVCLFLAGCGSVKTNVTEGYLTVGISPDYAPYEFYDASGAVVGSDVDFAKYLAQELGLELKIEEMEFDAILSNLSLGKIDIAISGMTYKKDRAENFGITSSYYNDGEGTQGIIILKSNENLYGSFEKLNASGVKIAAQNASLQHDLVKAQLPKAKLETVSKVADSVPLLLNGNYHAIAVAEAIADTICKNNPDIMYISETFTTEHSGLIGVVHKKNKELLNQVNDAIAKMGVNQYANWFNSAKELAESLGLE